MGLGVDVGLDTGAGAGVGASVDVGAGVDADANMDVGAGVGNELWLCGLVVMGMVPHRLVQLGLSVHHIDTSAVGGWGNMGQDGGSGAIPSHPVPFHSILRQAPAIKPHLDERGRFDRESRALVIHVSERFDHLLPMMAQGAERTDLWVERS